MKIFVFRHVITCWSSGTGGAGIFGAVSYACLKIWLSTKQTLLLMLIIPVLEGIAFWIILEKPKETVESEKNGIGSREQKIKVQEKRLKEKLRLVPTLLKYMLPLGLVYLFEYFINQGLVIFSFNYLVRIFVIVYGMIFFLKKFLLKVFFFFCFMQRFWFFFYLFNRRFQIFSLNRF